MRRGMSEMKKLLLPVLTACMLFPLPAYAEKFTAESKVTAVTVYTNRAAVTRTAKVKIPKGAHEVVFDNLPAQIAGDSLRVEGSAAAAVTLGALAHEQVVSKELTSAKERELSDALQALRDKIALEQAAMTAQEEKKKLLGQIGTAATNQTNEEFKKLEFQPQQWLAAATAIQEGLAEVLQAQHRHGLNIRTMNEDVKKLETELQKMRTGMRRSYVATVPLEASEATELILELSYQVGNASWQPLYDARLETGDGKLTLVQFGSVKQLTGEDWEGVSLTLSTAQPHRGAMPPRFSPQWLSKYDKGHLVHTQMANLAYNGGGSPVGGTADFAMSTREAAPRQKVAKKAQFAAAQVETGGFVAEYRVAGPATILSDNNDTKLMVGAFDIDSRLEVHVQPQHTTDAFLVARGKLKGEATVLAGQVNLFRDGAFIGKTHFPLLRPGEEHDLFFGVDDRISVKRNVVKDERKEGGMIIKDSILERHYVTEVQNLRQEPVELRVRETIPVSKDDSIKVEIVKEATTGGYESDIDKIVGLTGWSFSLAPQEKKEVRLGWKVTWPAGDNIRGLP